MGHGPSAEHIGNISEPLEGHLGDLASPGTPKAIEAIHAEITFATLEQNPNFKETHEFHYVFLKAKAPGDVIYNNFLLLVSIYQNVFKPG